MQRRVIAIQSDFGTVDGRAAKLIGTVKRVDASLDVCMTENKCPRGDTVVASTLLYSSLPFFPEGTVFVSIVERADGDNPPCAALTRDNKIILTPDNGTLTIWIHRYGLKSLRMLHAEGCPKGMNLYAYYAAQLAREAVPYEALGEAYPVSEANVFAMYPPKVSQGGITCGIFSVLENFGNLNLTVSVEEFEQSGICAGDLVHVTIERNGTYLFDAVIPYDRSFGFAELGAPILFNGSTGYLGLGMNQQSFAEAYLKDRFDHPGVIAEYRVRIRKSAK
jgi:S-adenosylmethionine hydrolase